MILIKLGGSVITEKLKEYVFREDVVRQLVGEISEYYSSQKEPIILVHGGGSFGHPGAKKYGLNTDNPRDIAKGTAEVQYEMRRLNQLFMKILLDNELWGVSIPGGVVSTYDDRKLIELRTDIFETLMDLETIPVTFGDVALDRTKGVTICSGDDLMMGLAHLANKAIFVTDIDGIIKDDEVMETFTEDMLPLTPLDRKKTTDVTGGMEGKVKKMIKMSSLCQTFVVNGLIEGRLTKLLMDEKTTGTEVKR